MSHLSKLLKKKRALRDAGTVSEADLRKLKALYRKGPAAYGSVANLKKAKYNHGVKYLLVAVDDLSRKLRVQPMRSKSASETVKSFARMIIDKKPKKIWSDKGTEFKGAFKEFCEANGIETYTTHSEAKSAFAERNIRSLKNIIYKHLENKWSYHYINQLQSFVNTINSRVNRMMGLAPSQVTKKHVARLIH